MRPEQWLSSVVAGFIFVMALAALAASTASRAADTSGKSSFRILFDNASSEPVSQGAVGEANNAAIARMADVIMRWSTYRGVRFIFVTEGEKLCTGRTNCTPSLFWQRYKKILDRIQAEVPRSQTLPFQHVSMSFYHELREPMPAAAPPMGYEAIDLIAEVIPPPPGTAICPWKIDVSAETFPPIIGGSHAIPVEPDVSLRVTPGGRLSLVYNGLALLWPLIVWENAQGEARRADNAAEDGSIPVPEAANAVHLAAAPQSDQELQGLRAWLTDEFQLVAKWPSYFRHAKPQERFPAPKGTFHRSVADYMHMVEPGAILAMPSPSYCFVPLEAWPPKPERGFPGIARP